MKRRHFTLIELLTVIGIIAILAGLLLPAISGVKLAAKKTKAKAQISAIVMAIKSYETTYGVLPWSGTTDVIWCDIIPSSYDNTTNTDTYANTSESINYDTLMQFLTKVNIKNESTRVHANAKEQKDYGNIRAIPFLDATEKFATESLRDPFSNPSTRKDYPLGTRYAIALDLDYNNQIIIYDDANNNGVQDGGEPTIDTVNGTVAVWSFGPDGENDFGQGSGSSGTDKYDDLASWRSN